MADYIKSFNPADFLQSCTRPSTALKDAFSKDYGRFFILKLEEIIASANCPIPPARLDAHTIIFLTKGSARLYIGFHDVQVKAQDCIIIPAGQVFRSVEASSLKGFVCSFDNGFLSGKFGNLTFLNELDFLSIWGNPKIQIENEMYVHLQRSLQRIYLEYKGQRLTRPTIIQSNFISILCELSHMYHSPYEKPTQSAVALTMRFKRLLLTHFKDLHLASDYAKMLHVTPNHLNKSVRSVTHQSVSRWIETAIVTEAKVMLAQSPTSISEISTELGIQDPSYFSRVFKKSEGMTPSQFRRKIE